MLTESVNLTELDCSGYNFYYGNIVEQLTENNKQLTKLNLSRCECICEHTDALIMRSSSITHLNLSHTEISYVQSIFAEDTVINNVLQVLNLSHCLRLYTGVLLPILHRCTALHTVYVIGCKFIDVNYVLNEVAHRETKIKLIY